VPYAPDPVTEKEKKKNPTEKTSNKDCEENHLLTSQRSRRAKSLGKSSSR
jgi:hypothetical protein